MAVFFEQSRIRLQERIDTSCDSEGIKGTLAEAVYTIVVGLLNTSPNLHDVLKQFEKTILVNYEDQSSANTLRLQT